MSDLPEHVAENRRYWDGYADEWVASGERFWALETPQWGQWGVPDDECPMLPDDMSGLDSIELGCGTAYVSCWMARRGATVTGIDNSERQLATAQRLADHHGVDLTLLHGNAEDTPFEDASFDFAISEYGAAIWCEPRAWLTEAHRLLRHNGTLVFLGNSPLSGVCTPLNGAHVDTTLHRSYFELDRLDWTDVEIDPGGIEFNRSISGWFSLFAEVGFSVDNYLEPRPPESRDGIEYSVPADWAKSYPSEQVWFLTKR
jgi:SAM-dependent methyltransferase